MALHVKLIRAIAIIVVNLTLIVSFLVVVIERIPFAAVIASFALAAVITSIFPTAAIASIPGTPVITSILLAAVVLHTLLAVVAGSPVSSAQPSLILAGLNWTGQPPVSTPTWAIQYGPDWIQSCPISTGLHPIWPNQVQPGHSSLTQTGFQASPAKSNPIQPGPD